MSRLWLKIAGVVVLVLVVTIGAYVLWPSTQQLDKQGKIHSNIRRPERPKQQRLQDTQAGEDSSEPSFYRDEPVAQTYLESKRLYDATRKPGEPFYPTDLKETKGLPLRPDSLRVKGPFVQAEPRPATDAGYDLSNEQFQQMYDKVIQHALEQYKDNPQEVGVKDTRGLLPLRPDSLRAKAPEEKAEDSPPADADAMVKLSPEQIQEIREMTLQHILEEYKDNPEQAEKIREILLERLRLLQKQSNAANAAGKKAD